MRRAAATLVTLGIAVLALPGSIASTYASQLLQWPYFDVGGFLLPADASAGANGATAAVAGPGLDLAPGRVVIDEIAVWGVYDAGLPLPETDSFTVIVHAWGFPAHTPGAVVCADTGIAGTRELWGTHWLGADVYLHTLRLSTPCDHVTQPNEGYWVEVFNDTGADADWNWISGSSDPFWPIDCCESVNPYGSAMADSAPGSSWAPLFAGPLAIEVRTLFPGEASRLRLGKEAEEIVLEWSPDCGPDDMYSVYRGDLSGGWSSLAPEPGLCDVTGMSAMVAPGSGAADFFIVVPRHVVTSSGEGGPSQGSYGVDSSGTERPQPPQHCYWQSQQLQDCAE